MNFLTNPQYIFLFILDAVRKDHLSLYGYKRKTTPNIDKLAKQADVYNFAISPSSYTHAAIPSLLTGFYPFELNNPFYSWKFSTKEMHNLKQIKKNDYFTALFTAHISSSKLNSNLYRFFDFYYEDLNLSETNRKEMLVGESKNVINNLINFVNKNKRKKIFSFIHLMEAHGPYLSNYKSIFLNDEFFKKENRIIEKIVFDDLRGVTDETLKNKILPRYQLFQPIYDQYGNIEDFNNKVKYYVAHYDNGIYTQDKYIGKFISYLKKIEIFDKSLIAITSDHGELIGENNIFFSHGIYTHPALINVPLIIKWPYQKQKKIIKENFSTQYLLSLIFKEINLRVNKNLNINNALISLTSQSISILKNNKIILLHNDKYHFSGCLYNCIFPIWSFTSKEIIENYLNLIINPHIKKFIKIKKNFIEVNNFRDKEDFYYELSYIFLKIIKFLTSQINKVFWNELKNKDQLINQLKNDNQNLQKQINNLNQTLHKIYTSKTWKILYFYKKLTSFFKK